MEIYRQRFYRKLLIITRNREDAKDALQDTFLRAYKGLQAFEERSSFYTWVTTIAINSALMILRRRRHRSEISFDRPNETEEDFAGLDFKDANPTPEHICVYRQRYARTLGLIEKLQPRLRQVIEPQMREISSIREIARVTSNIGSRREIEASPSTHETGTGSRSSEVRNAMRGQAYLQVCSPSLINTSISQLSSRETGQDYRKRD